MKKEENLISKGRLYLTCVNCKWFKHSPSFIPAPVEKITADGVCENKKWELRPIVFDAEEDSCFAFERSKSQLDKELHTALIHIGRHTEFYNHLGQFNRMIESSRTRERRLAMRLGRTIEHKIITHESYAPKAIRKQFTKLIRHYEKESQK